MQTVTTIGFMTTRSAVPTFAGKLCSMVNLRSRKIGNEGTTPRQNQEIGSASKAKKSKTALQRTTSFLKSKFRLEAILLCYTHLILQLGL